MQENSSFNINSTKVVHENIDGEVVIVHLQNGYYYSLSNHSSTLAWKFICDGLDVSSITKQLTLYFKGDYDEIEKETTRFLEKLLEEDILLINDASSESLQRIEAIEPASVKQIFEPAFDKYTDMEQLLTIDPIHEVDEAGWPNKPDNTA